MSNRNLEGVTNGACERDLLQGLPCLAATWAPSGGRYYLPPAPVCLTRLFTIDGLQSLSAGLAGGQEVKAGQGCACKAVHAKRLSATEALRHTHGVAV